MASREKSNAFSVLMSNKKRKGPHHASSSATMLVNCPICFKSIPNIRLNTHLDTCVQDDYKDITQSPHGAGRVKKSSGFVSEEFSQVAKVTQSAEKLSNSTDSNIVEGESIYSKVNTISNMDPLHDDDANLRNDRTLETTASPDKKEPTSIQKKSSRTSPIKNDAFSKMMKQSAIMYSSSSPRKQNFHLHSNFTVTWEEYDGPGTFASLNSHKWSNSVMVRKEISKAECDDLDLNNCHYQDLELHITSSVSSGSEIPRMVRRYSRLSVPTLKSILQKSIRRRQPLPAAKVALELVEKSWGDLVRRLPIIMFEESMLHNDFPLIVWSMVAESKGFVPPLPLIAKILRVVFEIASCPLKDDLSHANITLKGTYSLRTRLIDNELFDKPRYALMIRSMLLRASYGGMACDVSMLMDFSERWMSRFHDEVIPVNVSNRIRARLVDSNEVLDEVELRWDQIPGLAHSKAVNVSAANVNNLVFNGMEALYLKDICLAGIDFHCSSILEDVVLADDDLCSKILNLICKVKSLTETDTPWIHVLEASRNSMWEYSAGVNRRMRLTGKGSFRTASEFEIDDPRTKLYDEVWKCISSSVESYAKSYVERRLA